MSMGAEARSTAPARSPNGQPFQKTAVSGIIDSTAVRLLHGGSIPGRGKGVRLPTALSASRRATYVTLDKSHPRAVAGRVERLLCRGGVCPGGGGPRADGG